MADELTCSKVQTSQKTLRDSCSQMPSPGEGVGQVMKMSHDVT